MCNRCTLNAAHHFLLPSESAIFLSSDLICHNQALRLLTLSIASADRDGTDDHSHALKRNNPFDVLKNLARRVGDANARSASARGSSH